jgi:hypothetical protein
LTGALVEQLAGARYATCVIDPEGDYHVLAALPGVTWFAVGRDGDWNDVLGALRHDPTATVVADLSGVGESERTALVEVGLRRIRALRAARGFPHWVVLDEAHYSLHAGGVSREAFNPEDKGFCFVTHRPSWLRPVVVDSIDVFILARTTSPDELAFLRAHVGPHGMSAASALPAHEFLFAPRGAAAVTFAPPPRSTRHVRHLHKYADREVAPHHRFAFRLPGRTPVATVATLGDLAGALGAVEGAVLEHHAAHGDFSRWVLDVLGDRHLGGRLGKVERRWAQAEVADLRSALIRALGPVVDDHGLPGR